MEARGAEGGPRSAFGPVGTLTPRGFGLGEVLKGADARGPRGMLPPGEVSRPPGACGVGFGNVVECEDDGLGPDAGPAGGTRGFGEGPVGGSCGRLPAGTADSCAEIGALRALGVVGGV